MDWLCQTLFWTSSGSMVYSYAVYPTVIGLLSRMAGRQPLACSRDPAEISPDEYPRITVIIAAYNAARHLEQRISNLLACDYPASKLNILVASDGSTDATCAVIQQLDLPRVRVIDFDQRRGKAATLMEAVKETDTDVVVFTDASTGFRPDALSRLCRHFVYSRVDVVTGDIQLVGEDGRSAEGFYWRRESRLRRNEAVLGLLTGASGAIYAIRRRRFVAADHPIINDDLVFPILSQLNHDGYFVHDNSALAEVSVSTDLKSEFRRRVRIGTGACQALLALRGCFRFAHWPWVTAFVSHKVLRWFGFVLMLTAFVSNAALWQYPLYRWILAGQIGFYAIAALGLASQGRSLASRTARVAGSFCAMNIALLVGMLQWIRHPRQTTWQPTVRPVASQPSGRRTLVGSPQLRRASSGLAQRD